VGIARVRSRYGVGRCGPRRPLLEAHRTPARKRNRAGRPPGFKGVDGPGMSCPLLQAPIGEPQAKFRYARSFWGPRGPFQRRPACRGLELARRTTNPGRRKQKAVEATGVPKLIRAGCGRFVRRGQGVFGAAPRDGFRQPSRRSRSGPWGHGGRTYGRHRCGPDGKRWPATGPRARGPGPSAGGVPSPGRGACRAPKMASAT